MSATITQKRDLTIQQVAAETGLSTHTLRYYERNGLIHPIGRAENTHRRYSRDDIGWIQFLMKLRSTGMSIGQMLAYAELQRQGDVTLPERVAMLRAHKRTVEERMAEVEEHLKLISWKIEYYQGVLDAGAEEKTGDACMS